MADAMFAYIPLDRRIAFKKDRANERREWLERAHARNPRCHYCKNRTVMMPRDYNTRANHAEELFATLDHVVPRAAGGTDHPANWRLACAPCNMMKGDMGEAEYVAFLVENGVRQ